MFEVVVYVLGESYSAQRDAELYMCVAACNGCHTIVALCSGVRAGAERRRCTRGWRWSFHQGPTEGGKLISEGGHEVSEPCVPRHDRSGRQVNEPTNGRDCLEFLQADSAACGRSFVCHVRERRHTLQTHTSTTTVLVFPAVLSNTLCFDELPVN